MTYFIKKLYLKDFCCHSTNFQKAALAEHEFQKEFS
ncbi:MAG: hypothetical protein ACI9S8_002958 [Chlamydiales bacterium]|jgi:hypothetical protein